MTRWWKTAKTTCWWRSQDKPETAWLLWISLPSVNHGRCRIVRTRLLGQNGAHRHADRWTGNRAPINRTLVRCAGTRYRSSLGRWPRALTIALRGTRLDDRLRPNALFAVLDACCMFPRGTRSILSRQRSRVRVPSSPPFLSIPYGMAPHDFRPNRAFPRKSSNSVRNNRWIRNLGGKFRVQLGNHHGFLIESFDCPPISVHAAQWPSPSMRRPVYVKAHFDFLLPSNQFLLSQAAPVAILPSALFVSDIRSVQGGCSRFSGCCDLISCLCSPLCGGSWAPGLSRSHLDSAVELGGPDRNSKPLPASPSDYCAVVRTPLRPPTSDAAVLPAFAPRPLPLASWHFFLLARQALIPISADHCLLQMVPECNAPPAPSWCADTGLLLC